MPLGDLFAIITLKKVACVFGLSPKRTRCVESLFLLILTSYFPVFRHRLMIIASLAKRLPVPFIPEQLRITAMRCDVVDDRCRNQIVLLFAANTPGMAPQKELPGFLPFSSVFAHFCTNPFSLRLPFVFVTIFSSIRHQSRTARILAWRLWPSRHLPYLRHQKRTPPA